MKYLIELNQLGLWFNIQTNFVITDTLFKLIEFTKGVDVHGDSPRNRYEISFGIGKMFDVEVVNKDISKIIDAYIESNRNADKAEDKALMEFAEQAEQYNFIRNYKK
ncbi:MAG: hypothetical protein ACRC78_13610 [Planktothrix sp.]